MSTATKVVLAALAVALVTSACETPVDPVTAEQVSVAIAGPVVVWEDYRNGETNGADVYLYDTYNASGSLVAGGNGDQEQPVVSDAFVAWVDAGRLRALNRKTGAVFNVTTGPATQGDPALCGNLITWTDTRSGTPDVYARTLPSGPEVVVAGSAAVEAYPACDQGRVVYMEAPANQWAGIKLFTMATGTTTTVSAQAFNEWMPAISGDRVVWQAWPNQPDTTLGTEILGATLSTGARYAVSSVLGNQTLPAVAGSVVAWQDARSGVDRVWWRDLADGTTTQRPADLQPPGRQALPALSGRTVAYQADETGVWNAYTAPLLVPGQTSTTATTQVAPAGYRIARGSSPAVVTDAAVQVVGGRGGMVGAKVTDLGTASFRLCDKDIRWSRPVSPVRGRCLALSPGGTAVMWFVAAPGRSYRATVSVPGDLNPSNDSDGALTR